MRQLNRKEKILSIAVGTLVILFMFKSFVLGPIYAKINVYTAEIEQSKIAIRKFIALEHNRIEILKAQKQIEGYSSLRGTDEEKMANIMSKIEAQARKSKLQILDMNSAGLTKVRGGVVLYHINLRAEGQFKSVLDFISGIDESSILMQVEKINLSTKDETGTVLKIETTVLGVSFS